MSEFFFASLATSDVTSSPFFVKTDHFVTVGCALAALLSNPNTPLDAPPEALTVAQYRRAVELICPRLPFEEVDSELEKMHAIFDNEFMDGLRKAANGVRTHRRWLRLAVADWDSKDADTRGPEPLEIAMARAGVLAATALIDSSAAFDTAPVDTTRGKLALLVVEKMGLLELLERSKVSKDATFEATRLVLRFYNVI
ncbi:hypothetical protein FRC07_009820 [Ceratobasidium sp. 392]|nr:hypothetical protein FRC07_009820 [Ceratobasidium sp. 392]